MIYATLPVLIQGRKMPDNKKRRSNISFDRVRHFYYILQQHITQQQFGNSHTSHIYPSFL